MTIIVDTNILFSTCIANENKNRFSEIIYSGLPNLERISCYYAIAELFRHQDKLIKASKLPADKLSTIFYELLKKVTFYNEDTIDKDNWQEAHRLTVGVDEKDISFVALALQTQGILWTGDKKLLVHLRTMNFNNVVNTAELYELLKIG